ncbi:MAG: hypothetical protein M1500_01560 [Candidatus Marsarchaeota archaeon]|nr:hypothetical protein [Candidatus Marsarchaeota archaeon]
MSYSGKVEKVEIGIANAKLCLMSASAADAAIANPSIIEEDGGYNNCIVRGYWEVEDIPKTNNGNRLAEYKVEKLCDGMSDIVSLAGKHVISLELKAQIYEVYRAYLGAYPILAHEFIHHYIRDSPIPRNQLSEHLNQMYEAALATEDLLIAKHHNLTKLFEKEVAPLELEIARKMVSGAVDRLHHWSSN